MSRYQLSKGELIYSNASGEVKVWKGVILPENYPVAIKEVTSANLMGANNVIREAFVMASLQHAGICQTYDCFVDQNEHGQFIAVIVEEGLERDLWEEIQQRKNAGQVWSDAELMDALRQMVAALSCAQSFGIAHRDVKPQNIFLSGQVYKIGDFGSSTARILGANISTTIQGTPFFLSPELKQSFHQALQGVPYDPFKSDVYSLGLTILCMAMLNTPSEMNSLVNLEQTTAAYLGNLTWYPDTQSYLRTMLAVDPNIRPSFMEIQAHFDSLGSGVYSEQSQTCHYCGQVYRPDPQSSPSTYCSNQCYQRAQPTSRCAICSNAITDMTWTTHISTDLIEFQAFASDVCSEKCLRFYQGSAKQESSAAVLYKTAAPLLKEVSTAALQVAESRLPGSSLLIKHVADIAKSCLK